MVVFCVYFVEKMSEKLNCSIQHFLIYKAYCDY